MRCYLIRDGHFKSVELVDAATDAETIQLAIETFHNRLDSVTGEPYDGFELWDGNRVVHRYTHTVNAA